MTTRPYDGAALCWNKAHQHLYDIACVSLSNDNMGYFDDYQYQCHGVLPGKFYTNLVNQGENVCVCKFHSPNGIDSWVYEGEWGVCNGACTSPYFVCDGQVPIARDTPGQKYALVASSTANSSATTTSASSAASSQTSSSAASSIAAPCLTNIKTLLLFSALVWGYMLA